MLYKHICRVSLHSFILTVILLSDQILTSTGQSQNEHTSQTYNVCEDLDTHESPASEVPVRLFTSRGDKVYVCDTATDGGGWLIIQSRKNRSTDFNVTWEEYKNGFGSINSDFWLGNDFLHNLTELEDYELRVEVMYKKKLYFANYGVFKVGAEKDGYRLIIAGFTGNLSDSLLSHNMAKFSTPDVGNDKMAGFSCAQKNLSGWWFTDCFTANLNGKFTSVMWHQLHELNMVSSTAMKIRAL